MQLKKSVPCAAIILGLLAGSIHAGVLLVGTYTSSDKPQEEHNQKRYMEKDRLRVELENEDGGQIIIFRGDQEVFWVIDVEEKTYFELTQQDLRDMKAEMEKAMEMFEEQMKTLPPEQREMMRGMMEGKMPEKAPEITYKKTASGQKVGRWICDKYEGYSQETKQFDIWSADWKSLGFDAKDFEVLREVGEFFQEFVSGVPPLLRVGLGATVEGDSEEHFSGLPIKTVVYMEDQRSMTSEIKDIKKQALDPSLFELPEGFKKEKMPTE